MRKLLLRECVCYDAVADASYLEYSFAYIDPASKQLRQINIDRPLEPFGAEVEVVEAARAIRWMLKRQCGDEWRDPLQALPALPGVPCRYVYA